MQFFFFLQNVCEIMIQKGMIFLEDFRVCHQNNFVGVRGIKFQNFFFSCFDIKHFCFLPN